MVKIKGSGSCHIAGNIKPCSKEAVYHGMNHLCSWQAVLQDIILGTRQVKFRHLYKIWIIELSSELWIKISAMKLELQSLFSHFFATLSTMVKKKIVFFYFNFSLMEVCPLIYKESICLYLLSVQTLEETEILFLLGRLFNADVSVDLFTLSSNMLAYRLWK